jgi:hypothetical protein
MGVGGFVADPEILCDAARGAAESNLLQNLALAEGKKRQTAACLRVPTPVQARPLPRTNNFILRPVVLRLEFELYRPKKQVMC